mmetsp:Transcript_22990/g.53794  ORF Transcript_22990/g.53794 Transcript_22990/m.53794 type:complete len:107 (-) Transcript_22990:245-565(-)
MGHPALASPQDSQADDVDILKNMLREAVNRVETTMDQLRANWDEFEIRKQELLEKEERVARQMEEVSRMREQLELERSVTKAYAPKGGFFSGCCRPPVADSIAQVE